MTEDQSPLSQMMIDNADMIQEVIDTVGVSAVAEFFINTGTAIAAMYQLSDMPQGDIASIDAGEGN